MKLKFNFKNWIVNITIMPLIQSLQSVIGKEKVKSHFNLVLNVYWWQSSYRLQQPLELGSVMLSWGHKDWTILVSTNRTTHEVVPKLKLILFLSHFALVRKKSYAILQQIVGEKKVAKSFEKVNIGEHKIFLLKLFLIFFSTLILSNTFKFFFHYLSQQRTLSSAFVVF